jgi:hypothetical protein
MTVRMRFAVVTFLAAPSRMDVEFDSLDIFPLGPIDVDMEIANREFGSSHSNADGFTPRSQSAPTVISPLKPEKQSR